MRKTRTYQLWANVVARGRGTECPENYYDRGIRVCDRWLKFENFYEDMGDCPDGLSIDRINNDGNYEPGNCRWATATQQARNTRRNTILRYKGRDYVLTDLAEQKGICPKNLAQRIRKLRWSVEKAVETPVRKITK
jgi:hypothetical protein